MAKLTHFYELQTACNEVIECLCHYVVRCLLQFGVQCLELVPCFESRVDTTRFAVDKGSAFISVPYLLCSNTASGAPPDEVWRSLQTAPNGLATDIVISFTMKAAFDLVSSTGSMLTANGWSSVLNVLLWLFHLDLIPRSLFEMEDFTDSDGHPLPSLSDPPQPTEHEAAPSGGNVLSSLFWWLSGSPSGSPSEAEPNRNPNPLDPLQSENVQDRPSSADEHEDAHCPPPSARSRKRANIVESVSECKVVALFTASQRMRTPSFIHFVRALISMCFPERRHFAAKGGGAGGAEHGDVAGDGVDDEKRAESEWRDRAALSATTHSMTSWDAVPIESGKLMAEHQRRWTADGAVGDDYVVCLPLTVDLRLFCLERLSQTVCCNVARRHHVWNDVVSVFGHLLSFQMVHGVDDEEELRRHSEYLLERVTVSVFSVCSSLAAQCSVGVRRDEDVNALLALFGDLSPATLSVVARRWMAGIRMLLSARTPTPAVGGGDAVWR